MNVMLVLVSMVGSVLTKLDPSSASAIQDTLAQDVKEISTSVWPTLAHPRELQIVCSCSTTTSVTVSLDGGEDTARKERTSATPGLVRMAVYAPLQKLDSFANVQTDSLAQSAAIMETVDAPSTLAIMEELAWQTGPDSGASVSKELLEGTARLTTGTSACTTLVERMDAALTSQEIMTATAGCSSRGRTVIFMTSLRLEVLI